MITHERVSDGHYSDGFVEDQGPSGLAKCATLSSGALDNGNTKTILIIIAIVMIAGFGIVGVLLYMQHMEIKNSKVSIANAADGVKVIDEETTPVAPK